MEFHFNEYHFKHLYGHGEAIFCVLGDEPQELCFVDLAKTNSKKKKIFTRAVNAEIGILIRSNYHS